MARRKSKKPPLPIPLRPSAVPTSNASLATTTTTPTTPHPPPKRPKLSTQKLISTYHTLNKRLSHALTTNNMALATLIRTEMSALGGLNAYQRASLKGGSERQGLGASGTWLVSHLPRTPMTLLDIGAVSGTTYAKYSFITPTYIDLHPQHPNILQQDFMARPIPPPESRFDILCLSLVLNFVPSPRDRGALLVRTREHTTENGLLYIVLPSPCVLNSRYMTHERFIEVLRCVGFGIVEFKFAKRVAFYLFRRCGGGVKGIGKIECAPGKGRNNFCVVVDG
ncbi:25S rRNA (adenine2142-N1)-methyltransferase [Spizellomyces punctatus DAOM BR117]|uniref:25S rRNA adenine-N(1) methyltransferase n=1 Tax=Spizellomyces punctatus (strain DAOM BR117) TaxID=645134 RepID=A0A0L0HI92_SPIPD|nr:25S rRNA (adenine2142-N1)-methyltransferase [Spizellomyces punctatus DAOM BR117]KND00783.1 hypothetical protein SPPG_03896 [Spizellomyces punctatus DAOM BR117]|eukprot:XP_016608822.1 hypothetical protein SPPG_03896 [Spizellomyces punctatus DAOM BR117]